MSQSQHRIATTKYIYASSCISLMGNLSACLYHTDCIVSVYLCAMVPYATTYRICMRSLPWHICKEELVSRMMHSIILKIIHYIERVLCLRMEHWTETSVYFSDAIRICQSVIKLGVVSQPASPHMPVDDTKTFIPTIHGRE